MTLKRTQIYLEPEQHRLLKREAAEKGVSLAELVRQLASDHLHKEPRREDFARIVALGTSGVADASEEHDRYIGEETARRCASS
ncbi:MAG: CopG family transcriptional regulator [Candidatus Bipolaricaulota bacterium]